MARKMNRNNANEQNSREKAIVIIAATAFVAQLMSLAAALMYIASLSVLPMKYMLVLAAACAVICVVCFLLLGKGRGRTARCTLSMVVSLLVVALALTGILYLRHIYASYNASNRNARQVTTVMAVYVRQDAGYGDVSDLRGGVIGLNEDSQNRVEQVVSRLRELLGEDVQTTKYMELSSQVQALRNREVNAIVLNAAFVDTITEDIDSEFEAWAMRLPVEITVRHDVSTTEVNVTRDTFIVYISGIDNRGGNVGDTGRSDVNMLAVVNPTAKKILLVNTPRDYYLGLYGDSGKMDKLTHAGLYGVDCSMATLDALFGITTNYYVRVNFDSVVNIVDALGGITVNSDYTFYSTGSRDGTGYQFYVGDNELDGEAALAFARDRMSFGDGDRQRGKNQQKVISAIVDKATSPAILTNFNSVLSTVLENTRTNVSTEDINALIKMELSDMAKWSVESISVDGTGNNLRTYSAGYAYVMEPDMATVQAAIDAIKAMYN